MLSCVQHFVTLGTAAHQAPLPIEFSRQEYWSGLPFPPTRDLLNPGIQPTSTVSPALQANSLPAEPLGKPTLVAQWVKNALPMQDMQEMWVWSLGGEDPLEEEMAMATHSSGLAWRIPWAEEPGWLQFMGPKDLDMTKCTHTHLEHNRFHFWGNLCSSLCGNVLELKASTRIKPETTLYISNSRNTTQEIGSTSELRSQNIVVQTRH